MEVRLLDDVELVGALQEREDRSRHRGLGDLDELLGGCEARRADEQLGLGALVVRRDRDRIQDALALLGLVPHVGEPPFARSRTIPCAHGQAFSPRTHTPMARRVPAVVADATPISV